MTADVRSASPPCATHPKPSPTPPATAAPTRLELELEHDGNHLVVTVRDPGTSPHAWAPGVGVSSIRERSAEVGGTIELTNGPSGSTVRARLPLR